MPKAGRLTQLKVKEEDSHLKTEQVAAGNARKHTADGKAKPRKFPVYL